MSNTLDMDTNDMCCVTLDRPAAKELFYVPQPTFIIPIFRAPTTTSTLKSITKTSTSKIITAILKHEQKQEEVTSTPNMITQRIFENLILTNTIVAAFCIILMITLTGFLIFLLIPSIRRRWINEKQKEERKLEDLPAISRQQSFQQFTLGPSRYNPIFETAAGATTQFGPLFQIHPTIWTPLTSTPVVSSPIPIRQTQTLAAPVSASTLAPKSQTTATTAAPTTTNVAGRPPLPTHPPTTAQRSPRRRQQN